MISLNIKIAPHFDICFEKVRININKKFADMRILMLPKN